MKFWRGKKLERAKAHGLKGNRDAIAKELGVSHATIDTARAEQRGREKLLEELKLDPSTLKATAAQKLEIAKRKLERQAAADLAARQAAMEAEISRRVAERGREYLARLEAMEREAADTKRTYQELIQQKEKVFTPDQFKLILMCLHPDGERSKERLESAFRIFNERKLKLTGQK